MSKMFVYSNCLPHNNTTKALYSVSQLRLEELQNPNLTKRLTGASRLKINKTCKQENKLNHPLRLTLCITKEKEKKI